MNGDYVGGIILLSIAALGLIPVAWARRRAPDNTDINRVPVAAMKKLCSRLDREQYNDPDRQS